MTPLPRLRAGLATAALAALVLSGCTPAESSDGDAEERASSNAASESPAAVTAPAGPSSSDTAVEGDAATVLRVIDGDTVDVRRAGEEVRVRLLNIDTPETKHPHKAVQCMGPEATRFLRSALEPGDEVVLQYDQERVDGYGRTLAGVFEDGTFVNAEIARAGLGAPVLFEPNRRFYDEVVDAWNQAEQAQAGLNQPGLDCTLPAMAQPEVLGEEPPSDPAPVAELSAVGGMLSAARTTDVAVDALRDAYRLAAAAPGGSGGSGGSDGPSDDDGSTDWMGPLYAGTLSQIESTLDRYDGTEDHISWLKSEETRLKDEQRVEEQAQADAEARASAAAREAARAEEQAAAERAAEREAEQEAAEAAAEREAAAQAAAAREAAQQAAQDEETSSEHGGSGEATVGSGSTSNKAPNRCYHPGGQTFDYCDDQEASSGGGSSSGRSVSGTGGGSASDGGGPVSGSGGVCLDGYPVKVSGSNKYHLPDGRSYADTGSKRCYASAAAAEADGAVAAKG